MKLRAYILFLILSVTTSSMAIADIDWGGGSTRFYGLSGDALSSETGCAVLVAVSAGELIDFRNYIPEQPQDLVTVGASLNDGDSLNRVIAVSAAFYSGYLLYSAIPDVDVDSLLELGVEEGESLYIVIWDRSTFSDGLPVDSSYYTAQPLFVEGDAGQPVYVSLNRDSFFASVVYPPAGLVEDQTVLEAERAGHNAFNGFLDWLQHEWELDSAVSVSEARLLDSDLDGRSNFEEYVFRGVPRLGSGVASGLASSSGEIESDSLPEDGAEQTLVPEYIVELRANDANLSYVVHASSDLNAWLSSEIYFDEGAWHSTVPELIITGSDYVGAGVWAVAMRYEHEEAGQHCFYKMSVDELGL